MGKKNYDDEYDNMYKRSNKHRPIDKKQKRKKTIRSRKIGYTLVLLQLLITVLFCGLLIYINMIPTGYLVAIIGILAFFVIYDFGTQLTKKMRLPGKIISVILSITLLFGSYYIFETEGMLAKITGGNVRTDIMSVIVMNDDPAKHIKDAKDYNFGIVEQIDRVNTDKAIDRIHTLTGTSIKTAEYGDSHALVQALYDGKVKVIIINESNRPIIEENFDKFSDETRVIDKYTFITKLQGNDTKVKVTKEPFIVYLCGNDQTGDVSGTGRSDVNICAVVNPKSNQILLISTPRDYYMELVDPSGHVPAGSLDKLTHASNYGIDTSMRTLGKLYDTTLDYYVRVNFTGFKKIVDALGGVTVDSEYDFTSIDGFHFNKGINELDGERALHYARERKAFALGDMQRNKHQTQVLKAIIDKMVSPAILKNYSSLMDGVSDAFLTDFASKEISSLVKMQLNNGDSWNIVSYNVMGTGGKEYVYSISSFPTNIVYPNETDVANAKMLIKKVLAEDALTDEYIKSLANQQ